MFDDEKIIRAEDDVIRAARAWCRAWGGFNRFVELDAASDLSVAINRLDKLTMDAALRKKRTRSKRAQETNPR